MMRTIEDEVTQLTVTVGALVETVKLQAKAIADLTATVRRQGERLDRIERHMGIVVYQADQKP